MRINPDPDCGLPPRMGRNKADAVRSARPKGKRRRHMMNNIHEDLYEYGVGRFYE